MNVSSDTNPLAEPFANLPLQAETFSLTYHQESGWSAPLPDIDGAMTLVLAISNNASWNDRSALDELKKAYPKSTIAGCGASETISNGELFTDSISVGMIRFQSTEIKFAVANLLDSNQSRAAGREIATDLNHPNLRGVILFSNGLKVEATDLVRGIQDVLPSGIPIAGGLASDRELRHCWVNANGDLRDDAVCAVGLIGDKVELVCASGGGWVPASTRHVANKTRDKRIYQIDGRPAYDVFAERLPSNKIVTPPGPWISAVAHHSLALKLDGIDLVRSILNCNQEEGWLELAGDIPEGIEIEFMESSTDEILDGVDEAAHGIHMKTVGLTDNSLCLAFGCVGRVTILGDRISEEASKLKAAVGENICQVGMYSLGEILTMTCGHPQVHNLTMAAAVIREH